MLQESKTQKKLPNSKTITSKPTTVKDDVIDLISEDGEGKEEDESEDWKLRENKENRGIVHPEESEVIPAEHVLSLPKTNGYFSILYFSINFVPFLKIVYICVF